MKNTIIIRFLFLLPIFGFQCEENDKAEICNDPLTQISFTGFENLDGYQLCFLQNIDYSQKQVNIVINNQADFEKYVVCNDTIISIDFTKNTLLAGILATPNQDKVISQSISKKCEEYFYSVEIGGGVGVAPSYVSHFAVISKISPEAKVLFEVNYMN